MNALSVRLRASLLLGLSMWLVAVLGAEGQQPAVVHRPPPKLLLRSEHHPRLDGAIEADILTGARWTGAMLPVVLTFEAGQGAAVRSALAARGVAVATGSDTRVQIASPRSLDWLVQLLDELPSVAYARSPFEPVTLETVVGEGAALINAPALHRAGVLGQGVRVAVIDSDFLGAGIARARGELPADLASRDFTGTGLEHASAHGTAVAEIVHDIAPEAELLLLKASNDVELAGAVEFAIERGVDIINHSLGWMNTNFYDGTGAIGDLARRAADRGILWVSAAGNHALKHYEAAFEDADGDGWAEFVEGLAPITDRTPPKPIPASPDDDDELIRLQAFKGEVVQVYLTWEDWPRSRQDYDLYLYASDERNELTLVARSDGYQTGSELPVEQIQARAPKTGTLYLAVYAYETSRDSRIELFSAAHPLAPNVFESSILAPGNAPCVLTVAAIEVEDWKNGFPGVYSSQGPSNDGAPKPDLSAPAGVSTLTFGRFSGTSAAAPHVAGAAALLLSEARMAGQAWGVNRLKAALLRQLSPGSGEPGEVGQGKLTLGPPPGEEEK